MNLFNSKEQSSNSFGVFGRIGALHVMWQVLLVITISVFFALVARFILVPFFYGVKSNFSYAADVVSIDNFFNEETSMFSGETRSVTTFGYRYLKEGQEGVVLRNFFDVRTIEGNEIISIERDYGIDPKTRRHIVGIGDKNREGNLFAPRYLKRGEPFSYWHVNYDTKLELVFEKAEVINGLEVYRYSTSFGVDQTENLTHLALVPDERGVNLDVSLTLWVEPVSGWLVKYQDSAIAYYYDQGTKKRTHPWNKFSNTYRQASINKQVSIAQAQKMWIHMSEVFLPLLIFVGLTSFVFWGRKKILAVGVLVGGAALLVSAGTYFFYIFSIDERVIQVGITRWVPMSNPAYDENILGFKHALLQAGYEEGVDIEYIEGFPNANRAAQEEIILGFLEKDVSLIYSLTTPGTLVVKDMVPNRPVVFSIVTYPVEAGLIESLGSSGNNLAGTRNWVSSKRQLEVFLEFVPLVRTIGFLHRTSEVNSTIQLEEMRKAGEQLGVEIVEIDGSSVAELMSSLEANETNVDALFSACDTLIQGEAEEQIIAFAHTKKIPSFSCNITGPQNGDLMGLVADFYVIGVLAGEKAALILEGAPPSSLNTTTVSKPFLFVNQKTADVLGIEIPQSILLQAKQIIR